MFQKVQLFSFLVITFFTAIIFIFYIKNFVKYFQFFYKIFIKNYLRSFTYYFYIIIRLLILSLIVYLFILLSFQDNISYYMESTSTSNFNYPPQLLAFINSLPPIHQSPINYIQNSLEENNQTPSLLILTELVNQARILIVSEESVAVEILEMFKNIELANYHQPDYYNILNRGFTLPSLDYLNLERCQFYSQHLGNISTKIHALINPILIDFPELSSQELNPEQLRNCYHLCKELFDMVESIKIKPQNISDIINVHGQRVLHNTEIESPVIHQIEVDFNNQLNGLQQEIWSKRGQLITVNSSENGSIASDDDMDY